MRKKIWNSPTLIILQNDQINSGGGTRGYFENVYFTVDNTCTFNGVGCTTAEGVTYFYEFTNVTNASTFPQVLGVTTCTPSLQCS